MNDNHTTFATAWCESAKGSVTYWYIDQGNRNLAFCTEAVERAGWILPKPGAKQVRLVFTTKRTVGASTCRGRDLFRGGLRGWMHETGRSENELREIEKLYWWPEEQGLPPVPMPTRNPLAF